MSQGSIRSEYEGWAERWVLPGRWCIYQSHDNLVNSRRSNVLAMQQEPPSTTHKAYPRMSPTLPTPYTHTHHGDHSRGIETQCTLQSAPASTQEMCFTIRYTRITHYTTNKVSYLRMAVITNSDI